MTTNEIVAESSLSGNSIKIYYPDETLTVAISNGINIFGNNIPQGTTILTYDDVDDIVYLSQNLSSNISNFDTLRLGSNSLLSNIITVAANYIGPNTEPQNLPQEAYNDTPSNRIKEIQSNWLNLPEQSGRFNYVTVTRNDDGTETWQRGNFDTDPDDTEYMVFDSKLAGHLYANNKSEAQSIIATLKDNFFPSISDSYLVMTGYSSLMSLIVGLTIQDEYLTMVEQNASSNT